MDSRYAYTPAIWPSMIAAVFLFALALYSVRRRSVPGALPFAIASLFGALWAAGSVMDLAAVEVQTKIFWYKFQSVCQLPIVIAMTCFVLEYAWPGRWLTRRNLALLSFPWLLQVVLMLTNDLHHLVWRSFGFDGSAVPQYGPGGLILLAYAYGLAILDIIIFAWLFLRSPQHRWPVAIMLTGLVVGRAIFLLDRTQILNADLPIVTYGMAFDFLMYAIALFGFRLFDPIPLARQTAIKQMQDGMLVLDHQGQVASLNPAAGAILATPAKRLVGRPIQELLPTYTDMAEALQAAGACQVEMSLGTGPDIRFYQLEASSLKDRRGLEVGRLLLLHDVSGQKHAQAQLLEQQRALATLQERERVARELHDSLGQVLGYVKMQAQAARGLLAQNQPAEADDYLAQLVAVAQDAHADVREYILGARVDMAADADFLPALIQYLRRFSENYGIAAELSAPPELSDGAFEPMVEAQLLRIIQEALTNVRKHAQAHRVHVGLSVYDSRAEVTVQDDGAGFDPEMLETAEGQKFGLGFMQERAEEVGGSVQVHSAPGEGTRLIIDVPLRKDEG